MTIRCDRWRFTLSWLHLIAFLRIDSIACLASAAEMRETDLRVLAQLEPTRLCLLFSPLSLPICLISPSLTP